MYTPKAFEVSDRQLLRDFINQNSFGIFISQRDGRPFATHVPFLFVEEDGQDILLTHVAKANPQWDGLDDQKVLVVFQGPHAYISARWYESNPSVPTWNYVAVHVNGTANVIADSVGIKTLLAQTLHVYEGDSNAQKRMDDEFHQAMAQAVVGIRIRIESMEGKWKLSQNHTRERQWKVVRALQRQVDPGSAEIARLMEQNLTAE